MINEDIDLSKFFELASSDQVYVTGLNLHEIKNETPLGYRGDFELNGLMDIGPVKHKMSIRFRSMDDFES